MIRILLIGLGLYLLYKLVFDLIIPVYRTTNQVRQQFNDIKAKMEQQNQNMQDQKNAQTSSPPAPNEKVGEYIDFEEIK